MRAARSRRSSAAPALRPGTAQRFSIGTRGRGPSGAVRQATLDRSPHEYWRRASPPPVKRSGPRDSGNLHLLGFHLAEFHHALVVHDTGGVLVAEPVLKRDEPVRKVELLVL